MDKNHDIEKQKQCFQENVQDYNDGSGLQFIKFDFLTNGLRNQRNTEFLTDRKTFQLSPSISIDLMKMKNRDYLWLFMNNTPKITALGKWERDLLLSHIHWKDYFKQLKFICKK